MKRKYWNRLEIVKQRLAEVEKMLNDETFDQFWRTFEGTGTALSELEESVRQDWRKAKK